MELDPSARAEPYWAETTVCGVGLVFQINVGLRGKHTVNRIQIVDVHSRGYCDLGCKQPCFRVSGHHAPCLPESIGRQRPGRQKLREGD